MKLSLQRLKEQDSMRQLNFEQKKKDHAVGFYLFLIFGFSMLALPFF